MRILFALLLFFCFACGRNGNPGSDTAKTEGYYLEKVDSIHIDRENTVTVLDFNPVNKEFLAYDQITQEFLLLDERGQVLEAVYRVGEGPNEYNSRLNAASFNQEERGYYLLSSRDFLWFNDNWEVEKRVRFASHIQINYYTGPRHKVPYYTLLGVSDPFVYTNFFPGTYPGVGGDADEATSKYLIELYNPQNDSLEWMLPNDPQLLPESDLDEENRQISPVQVYALDNEAKLMYLTFERSGEIGTYDLANDLSSKKKLPLTRRALFNPINPKTQHCSASVPERLGSSTLWDFPRPPPEPGKSIILIISLLPTLRFTD